MSKKLKRFVGTLFFILANSKGELDTTGEGEIGQGLDKYLDESWSGEQSEGEAVESEPEQQASEPEAKEDDSLESLLDSFEPEESKVENKVTEDEEESAEEEKSDLLAKANELGITRNDQPVKFESEDQLKEVLSKGFDYTQKTQEHAETLKAFEEEKANFQEERENYESELKEVQGDLISNQVLFKVLKRLESEDEDLVSHIESMYDEEMNSYESQYNHPAYAEMQQQLKEQQETINQLSQKTEEKEDQFEVEKFEKGLSEVQKAYGDKLKPLGIVPKWDDVKEVYRTSAGKLDVKAAFFAVHGDQLAKAKDAHNKLLETKTKSKLRTSGQEISQDLPDPETEKASESMFDAARRIAKKLSA